VAHAHSGVPICSSSLLIISVPGTTRTCDPGIANRHIARAWGLPFRLYHNMFELTEIGWEPIGYRRILPIHDE
jgi:hypothetical protein